MKSSPFSCPGDLPRTSSLPRPINQRVFSSSSLLPGRSSSRPPPLLNSKVKTLLPEALWDILGAAGLLAGPAGVGSGAGITGEGAIVGDPRGRQQQLSLVLKFHLVHHLSVVGCPSSPPHAYRGSVEESVHISDLRRLLVAATCSLVMQGCVNATKNYILSISILNVTFVKPFEAKAKD